jgi:hypothetical protein
VGKLGERLDPSGSTAADRDDVIKVLGALKVATATQAMRLVRPHLSDNKTLRNALLDQERHGLVVSEGNTAGPRGRIGTPGRSGPPAQKLWRLTPAGLGYADQIMKDGVEGGVARGISQGGAIPRTRPADPLGGPDPGPAGLRWAGNVPAVRCSAEVTFALNALKPMSAGVDIGRWCGYGFCRSRDRAGPAEMNCRAAVHARWCGGGVPEPDCYWTGDGADGRTGWPAVFRGRHEQYRSTRSCSSCRCSWQYQPFQQCSVSGFSVKASGCGRACREVRQWGSKPERMQDGQRGWLPDTVALSEATSSSHHQQYSSESGTNSSQYQQYAVPVWQVIGSEGRTEESSAIRIARAEGLSPGTARPRIGRWSPVTHPRSPHPRPRSGRVCGHSRPVQH